jgi:hypothetical protein
MGVYPAPFLRVMDASVANLVEQHHAALARAGTPSSVVAKR